jgi:ribose/xylose/arabinose/galactoside ABC-type transport system permease subunit
MRSVAGVLLVTVAIGLNSLSMSVISSPQDAGQAQAMAGISVGCAYMVLGAVQGLRLAAVGLTMIVITLGGWVFAREYFMLWSAVAAGGGLVLGGLWLRTA